MGCNCNNIIRATSYTAGAEFTINTNFSISALNNCQRFVLILPSNIPATTSITTVNITMTVNGTSTTVPLQNIVGNNLMSDQIRFICKNQCGNRVIRLVYGSNPTHFKVLQCLPESSAVSSASNGGSN